MRVELLYFGMLKERFGSEREFLDIGPYARVSDLICLLRERSSNQEAELWESLAVAVNREYAGAATLLSEGDEVALLPPVSGGTDAG